MAFETLAKMADTAPGTITVHELGDVRIALCNVNGKFYAIDDVCTHDGGALDQGELEGNLVECPRHGARFDLLTGEVKALPAVFPVNAYPVRVVDGRVEVDLGVPTKELEIG
jgi:3-phenylpropionate/trans-cinnamate dioxygenase ferredoxin subunit